jgi:SAM-dependent methyltransferase
MSKPPLKSHRFYKEFPATCRRDDLWGQVKRTINGEAVSQDQIDILVNHVISTLNLQRTDVLLDLCCGNGALSDLLFDRCSRGVGVDFSEFLVEIAKEKFERIGSRDYHLADVVTFVQVTPDAATFDKILCSSGLQYLTDGEVETLFLAMNKRFTKVDRALFANLPDLSRFHEFCRPESYREGLESDLDTAIGIWRHSQDLLAMANAAGWSAKIGRMSKTYYASYYRYDLLLIR